MARETKAAATLRHQQLQVLQEAFSTFEIFLCACMEFLGFFASPLQKDIGRFIENSSGDIMVQAQRSQAKSTITAIFAVYFLIHRPNGRVLVVSAGGKQANEISTLITKLILFMPELECMRPDRTNGDRVSVENFDIHYSLKGLDKSPSVACTGITANLQGKRADLLIADDVESEKNSRSQGMRELLMTWTRDFSSIVQNGRVIYLGTPQSMVSIYNSLPARGITVRIWPGRFPTAEQIGNYGRLLAPSLLNLIAKRPDLQTGGGVDGKQGKPTDPKMLGEELLQKKEMAQGEAYFQLQHMLNTALADANKFPLKSKNLIVMRLADRLPVDVTRGMTAADSRKYQIGDEEFEVMWPCHVGTDYSKPELRVMYVDPAGGGKNADETAWTVLDMLNSRAFAREISGMTGGYELDKMEKLAYKVAKWRPDLLVIEKNFGFGAFAAVFQPVLKRILAEAKHTCALEEEFVTTRKEDRIINTLEPVIGRGALVLDEQVLLDDWYSTGIYAIDKRQTYTFATQFSRISRDVGALLHDDRIDSLVGALNVVLNRLKVRDDQASSRLRAAEHKQWVANPLGHPGQTPNRKGPRAKSFRK